jgi:hypothetical protein
MRAALLIESLTGHTQKAGEMIAANLQQEGWGITGISRLRAPVHAELQAADIVIVGTWVHGLFVVGQGPFGLGYIDSMPAIGAKQAAVFCTFALDPKKTLDTMSRAVESRGASVIGGLALNRWKLAAHSELFATRLIAALQPTPGN